MKPDGWHILTIKPGLPIRAVLFILLLTSPATTLRLVAEEAPAAPTDATQTESAPESPPPSEPPLPPDAPSPSETLSQPSDSTDPEQILEEALAAMDTAALELEGDTATDKAVREQELAVTLLQKLLSASQSSKPGASSQPPAPESESDQPSADSSSDPNGSTGRRSDDENSKESSENVAGPAQSGASSPAPNIRTNSVWGHLPPREQESLLRSLSDNFLPEYEAQIKRYYEALAEGRSGRGGR